ncbi:hypothetical protein RvY_15923-1 [Ramazzottius varieornatus]|uniref:DUF1907 domain-containing protein n=1 Tax=Ramazzottius varieornatus TaxID=947166 RepID=A0A1D1W174_RAMVA|nr:hypothetical protein RvY_15923-1 [Ramazzottius varieornatus]
MNPEAQDRSGASGLRYSLEVPSLEDLVDVFRIALEANFRNVAVRIVDCPDLTEPPYGMAAKGSWRTYCCVHVGSCLSNWSSLLTTFIFVLEGISKSTKISDVGGVRYLTPLPQLDHKYDLQTIAKESELSPPYFIMGAGCGPYQDVGCNCELMANVAVSSAGVVKNESRIAKLDKDGKCQIERLQTTNLAILGNFFLSAGEPGKVVEIRAEGRTGSENFVSILRQAVRARYQEKPVGIGGVFLVEKGSLNIHVMPDFSKAPLETEGTVDQWLKYFTQPAPMVFMSVFVSEDPGWDLRCEHTHGYGVPDAEGSSQNRGGHYHYGPPNLCVSRVHVETRYHFIR